MYNSNTYQNYYQQSRMNTPTAPPAAPMYGLKGRPVSSVEEVRATSIDFDGSVFFFPDLANKRIYTKQINIDGTAILNMYELKEIPIQSNIPTGDFITRKEFEDTLSVLKNSLAETIQQMNKAVAKPQEPASEALNF